MLQPWRAPDHIEVTELAGIGIPTISGFEYRQFHRLVCETEFMIGVCVREPYYKPVPQFSVFGDETVMLSSAQGYRGKKRSFVLDMDAHREIGRLNHVNITESPMTHQWLSSLLYEGSDKIRFISEVKPIEMPPVMFYVLGINSPAELRVLDESGNTTYIDASQELLRREEGIAGSRVFSFGSTTLAILPADGEYTLEIAGTGAGIVTLELDVFGTKQRQTNVNSIEVDQVSSTTRIYTTLSEGKLHNLSLDNNGDGKIDTIIDSSTGEVSLVVAEDTVNEIPRSTARSGPVLRGSGEGVSVTGVVAGLAVSVSDQEDVLLEQLLRQLYEALIQLQEILRTYEFEN